MRGSAAAGVPAWSMAVVAMLLIQVANALAVGAVERVGPAGTAWLKLCFGAVFLCLIVRPSIRSIRGADLPMLLVLAAATGFMSVFFHVAVERIPLGTIVAIELLGPLTVAGIVSRRRGGLVWPILALVGVVLLTEPWVGRMDLIGVGFALLSGVCWALYAVLTQRVGDRFAGISGLAITIPIAALLAAPIGVPQVVGSGPDPWLLLLVAGIALISPVVSFGLEMLALRRMTQTAFGTLLSLQPAFGVLIGLSMLGQLPGAAQVAGVAIVAVAASAAQRGGSRAEDPG